MAKKCVYCKSSLADESVIDVCKACGIQVWGEKMFATIIQNMEGARDSGDLFQGSVTEKPAPNPESAVQENPLE